MQREKSPGVNRAKWLNQVTISRWESGMGLAAHEASTSGRPGGKWWGKERDSLCMPGCRRSAPVLGLYSAWCQAPSLPLHGVLGTLCSIWVQLPVCDWGTGCRSGANSGQGCSEPGRQGRQRCRQAASDSKISGAALGLGPRLGTGAGQCLRSAVMGSSTTAVSRTAGTGGAGLGFLRGWFLPSLAPRQVCYPFGQEVALEHAAGPGRAQRAAAEAAGSGRGQPRGEAGAFAPRPDGTCAPDTHLQRRLRGAPQRLWHSAPVQCLGSGEHASGAGNELGSGCPLGVGMTPNTASHQL